MSTQPSQDLDRAPPDAQAVADYLRANPDFFVSRCELLTELLIPHHSGEAVSLVERQLSMLREQNQHLRRQLQTLIHNARGNEELSERMHALTLALLAFDGPERLFVTLAERLREDFDADALIICLVQDAAALCHPVPPGDRLEVRHVTSEQLQPFDELLEGRHAVCGRLTHRQMSELFGEGHATIGSAAVAPLQAPPHGRHPARTLGLMGIGSRDAQRFQAGMGTVFLKQLADIVAARLSPAQP